MLDTILNESDGSGFHSVPCPHCKVADNLDISISDYWVCGSCGGEYWITPLTLVSSTPPRTERDKDGNAISVQISFGYLSLFPREYMGGGDANNANS